MVIETLLIASCYQLHNILIALYIFSQKSQMVGSNLTLYFFFLKTGGRSYIYLTTNDRLYPSFLCLLVKIYSSK
ncbi:hypothetical protein ES703_52939 [subsurface metagenome]